MVKPELVKATTWISSTLKFKFSTLFSWIFNKWNWCELPRAALTSFPKYRQDAGNSELSCSRRENWITYIQTLAMLVLGTVVLLLSSRSSGFHYLISGTILSGHVLYLSDTFLLPKRHFQWELHTEGISTYEVPPSSGLTCLLHLIMTYLRQLQGNLMDTLMSQKFQFFHLNCRSWIIRKQRA